MSDRDTPKIPRFASASLTWSRAAIGVLLCGLVASFLGLNPEWVCPGVLIAAILCCIMVAISNARCAKRVSSNDYSLCLRCGYDLRGSPGASVCSECGEAFTLADTRAAWAAWMVPKWSGHAPEPIAVPRYVARMPRWAWLSVIGLPIGITLGSWLHSDIAIVVPTILAPALAVLIIAIRSSRVMLAAQETDYQLCMHCAYDMRSNPPVGVCPECGKPYNRDMAQMQWRTWCLDRNPQ